MTPLLSQRIDGAPFPAISNGECRRSLPMSIPQNLDTQYLFRNGLRRCSLLKGKTGFAFFPVSVQSRLHISQNKSAERLLAGTSCTSSFSREARGFLSSRASNEAAVFLYEH